MKPIAHLALCLIISTFYSSCSCAIHHEVYTASVSERLLKNSIVSDVATANGFVAKPDDRNRKVYSKRDVQLFYSDKQRTLTIHSSYCPFIPFKMNPRPWDIRCDQYTNQILDSCKEAGLPLRQLSRSERQTNYLGKQ